MMIRKLDDSEAKHILKETLTDILIHKKKNEFNYLLAIDLDFLLFNKSEIIDLLEKSPIYINIIKKNFEVKGLIEKSIKELNKYDKIGFLRKLLLIINYPEIEENLVKYVKKLLKIKKISE